MDKENFKGETRKEEKQEFFPKTLKNKFTIVEIKVSIGH